VTVWITRLELIGTFSRGGVMPRRSQDDRYLTLNLIIFWILTWMRVMLRRLIELFNRTMHYLLLQWGSHGTAWNPLKPLRGLRSYAECRVGC